MTRVLYDLASARESLKSSISDIGNDGGSMLSILLSEQQELTAVEELARAYDGGTLPAQARYYSRLLPATPPGPGQQYGFEVDLDRCSGCKACVTACHSLNGLDEHETWRDVGLLIGGTSAQPVMQHVTTACHHCLQPACAEACPVDAYEKDPHTGIVRHLDDQCFGCQYCTLACPYDVPKYHHEKGIVRKCDMCSGRLAVGEAPACVQACPHEAISIRLVDVAQVAENAEADHFLPAAPEPYITLPTTTFKTNRVFPRNMLPADYYSVNPQSPHWPLIVMLVLTQLSVGAFLTGLVLEARLEPELGATFRQFHATSALVFGLVALGASLLHLGRPLYAFRALIGLRHSWLSREIAAFGLFAGSALLYAIAAWLPATPSGVTQSLSGVVAVSGLAGLFCSTMIYVFTQREFWSFGRTATRFGLTAAVLGIAAAWLSILLLQMAGASPVARELATRLGPGLATTLAVVSLVKLVFEAAALRHLTNRRNSPLTRSARLMIGPLSNFVLARFACGLLGGIIMPLLLANSSGAATSADELQVTIGVSLLVVACFVGDFLERYLFFAAVAAPRMPGGFRS